MWTEPYTVLTILSSQRVQKSRQLPNLPQDGEKVIGYREAMTLKKQPKSMIVVGSGAIGVEFAHFYNAMGTDCNDC